MSRVMEIALFDSSTIGIITTVAATVLLAVLAYVAQFLVKSGDVTAEIKRMAYIDIYEVRLQVHFASTKKAPSECNDLFLAADVDGVLLPISEVAAAPLAGMGSTGLVTRSEVGYGFKVSSEKPFEGYFDFRIKKDFNPNKLGKTYLVCTDEKGRKRKAEFVLNSTAFQTVRFKKA